MWSSLWVLQCCLNQVRPFEILPRTRWGNEQVDPPIWRDAAMWEWLLSLPETTRARRSGKAPAQIMRDALQDSEDTFIERADSIPVDRLHENSP